MVSKESKTRILSELTSILDDDSAISLRSARRLSVLIKVIDEIEESDLDQKTISGSPNLSPGTITIQMNGIPDQDGAIEASLKRTVFEIVNHIIESRSDPEIVEKRRFALETAQKYRDDENETPEVDLI